MKPEAKLPEGVVLKKVTKEDIRKSERLMWDMVKFLRNPDKKIKTDNPLMNAFMDRVIEGRRNRDEK